MSKKELLRKATLGTACELKTKIVEFNGQQFEIRQPTIKGRSILREKCSQGDALDNKLDIFEFLVWSVVENTYVPHTNERVFEDSDYDVLIENATGGFMDQFSQIASELINVDIDTKKK